jgi:hypothetical protein
MGWNEEEDTKIYKVVVKQRRTILLQELRIRVVSNFNIFA